ncbi:MAG TPA: hypothetical protein VE443_00850 [Beijerinckiaceae bacterium]|jgi:hypothetical protein|nr:hypothetical protein [Beijerinckiaceae bacterium]
MPDEPPAQRGSKAGRNEGRKLTATALNNTGVAFVLAALLQPALAYLQQQRSVDFPVMVGSTIFMAVGVLLCWLARRSVRKLED